MVTTADGAVEAIEAVAGTSADGGGVVHQEAAAEVGGGGVERPDIAWIHCTAIYNGGCGAEGGGGLLGYFGYLAKF
jgi:hypothetical protein